jgi:hypothetical protein
MPAETRLKLFLDVCHAIQHEQHKGVIRITLRIAYLHQRITRYICQFSDALLFLNCPICN